MAEDEKYSYLGRIKKRREYVRRREIASRERSWVGGTVRYGIPEEKITAYLARADVQMARGKYDESAYRLDEALDYLNEISRKADAPKYLNAIDKRVSRLTKKVMSMKHPKSKLLKKVEGLSERVHGYPGARGELEHRVSRVGIFILSSIAGIALMGSSFSITGNAISNLTGTSNGLLGLFLLVVGLFGIIFSRD